MPTGYTSFIEDGKVKTSKEFLHLCLRAFGACFKLMDYPLEVKDDYTDDLNREYQKDIEYHQKNLDESKKYLKIIQEMTDDELCEKYISETRDKIKRLEECRNKDFQNYADYLRIKEEIESWNCDKEFEGIKKFAIDQIDMSISKSSYYDDELAKCGEPTREGFEKVKDEYRKSLTEDTEWNINYHQKEIEHILESQQVDLECYKRFKEDLKKLG